MGEGWGRGVGGVGVGGGDAGLWAGMANKMETKTGQHKAERLERKWEEKKKCKLCSRHSIGGGILFH